MTVIKVTDADLRADIEAKVRRLMARRAATPTSWQFRKQRAMLQVEIDEALDEWLAA